MVQKYIDKDAANRDWNLATAMVINGKAGMQFMGDWAKGEFLAAGKKPETDFVCTAAPGTWKAYIYNIDSFAMFRLQDAQAVVGQKALATTISAARFGGMTMATSLVLPRLPVPVLSPTRHAAGMPARRRSPPVFVATIHSIN